jgi:hypothetical protein
MWSSIARAVHFTAQPWMSASIMSFVVAGVVTLLCGLVRPAPGAY